MTRLLKNLLLSLTHKQCNIFRIKMLKSLHIIARRLSGMSNNIKFVTHVVLQTVKSVNIHNCAILEYKHVLQKKKTRKAILERSPGKM